MAIVPPERGTLIIAALLLLALTFTGVWIVNYVDEGHAPWEVLPWFGAAAVAIIVVGALLAFRGGRG